MLEKPKFLQGIYRFEGRGLEAPQSLSPPAVYKIPFDKRSQTVYFRGGNSCDELIYVLLLRDGKPMRYFPIGARSAIHVPLSVVEDLHPETSVELQIAAVAGAKGSLVLDLGFTEF
jgi:hypothetical protein